MIEFNESNFIFDDLQEAPTPRKVSRKEKQINQHQLSGQNSTLNTMMHLPNKMQHKKLETNVIFIQPVSKDHDRQEKDLQIIQFSPPSEKKKNYSNKQLKEQFYHQSIIYPYEQSLEIQEDPQSSIRKLYKAMQQAEQQIGHSQEEKSIMIESESHLYHDDSEQQENEQVNTKSQVRSQSLRKLILFRIPTFKMIKCLVKIVNDSFFTLQSIFHLYLVQQKKLIMSARKKRFRIASKYEIFGKEHQHVEKLGLVKSNYSRTEYKLSFFRSEDNQKEDNSSFSSSIIKISKIEQTKKNDYFKEEEMAYLSYEPNFLGASQQKIQLIIPKKSVAKSERFSDLKAAYQNCEYQRVERFANRLAQRDHQGRLVMDFKDSNIIHSTRNTILENEFGETCLVFGKMRDDLFALYLIEPFNFLQAFFLAICNLDRKLFVH